MVFGGGCAGWAGAVDWFAVSLVARPAYAAAILPLSQTRRRML